MYNQLDDKDIELFTDKDNGKHYLIVHLGVGKFSVRLSTVALTKIKGYVHEENLKENLKLKRLIRLQDEANSCIHDDPFTDEPEFMTNKRRKLYKEINDLKLELGL